MIKTTTDQIEGRKIIEYKGIVFGDVITRMIRRSNIGAKYKEILNARSKVLEEELFNARNEALLELESKANNIGANALVGVKIEYQEIKLENNILLMVSVSGTAVIVE